jgi:HSP20 family protein
MAEDLIRLMRALFQPAAETLGETAWRPSADIYHTTEGWVVKFDLAGVRPEDIRVSVSGRRLTVSGCRRDCFAQEGHSHYQLEIAYSHFERSLELPCNLESAAIAIDSRDGMLLVHIQTETQT